MPPSFRKLIDSWYPGCRGTLGTGAFTLIDPVSWHGVRPATSGTDKLNKAFTLIELLIVITILAILGSAISIVLNPAELLAEARDSQRINDLESLRNSLSLTLIDNPSLFGSLSNTSIYLSLPSSSCLTNPPSGYTYVCNASSLNLQKTDSSGWLPLSLTNLPVFPIDPVNSSSSSLYYAFVPDSTNKTFVLTSLLESEKYLKLSALKDGGTDPSRIEEGNPSLWTSASGLVGYWPMDEGSGTTAQDLSGNNNAGTLTNGPTWTASSSCKVGQCLSFDGVDDVVNISFAPSIVLNNYTFSAWVNPSIFSSYRGIIQSWPNGGEFQFLNSSVGVHNVYGGNLLVNNWYYVVASVTSGMASVYVDGNLMTSGIISGTTLANIGLGNLYGASYNYDMTGKIDEAKIYKRALSEAEIKAVYSAQK